MDFDDGVVQRLAARSHELRTPLNTIVGYSELLLDELDGLDPAAVRADLGRILDAGRQLLGLLEEALRVQEVEVEPTRECCDLHELLRGLLPSLRALMAAQGLRLEWTLTPQVRVLTDPAQVAALVRVVIGRAGVVAAARVHLGLSAEGDRACIEVFDDGERARGVTGLELAERCAQRIGGRVAVEAGVEGTRVRVLLPAEPE